MFQKLKKNEYFCIFLSLPIFCRCFADFDETLFSGPRRFFPQNDFYNIGLNNSVELALANLDLNELVLDPVTFDDGDPLEGSSSRVHMNKGTDCIGYRGGRGGGWRREQW
jgi:hypothetical protein